MRDLASRLTGVLCATITPFQGADHAIDYDGIATNARWLMQRGVDVLVVNGTIGEASSLSAGERGRAVAATARGMSGDGILIAGCSGDDVGGVLVLAREAAAAGAHALLIAPPPVPLPPDECVEFFTVVDREAGRPFVVYDNPMASRKEMSLDTLDRISRLDRFLALKEANPDVVRFAETVNRFGSRFPVIAASEDPLLFTLVAGAPACMTASAAFAPEVLRELFDAVGAGDLSRAREVYSRIRAFRRLFAGRSRPNEPAYLPFTKAAVELVGGKAGAPRPPLRPITDVERSKLRQVLVEEMKLAL